jgi:tetratricopeptide (TPR) repeat protein
MKKSVEDNIKKGRKFFLQYLYSDAIECFNKAIKLKPNDDNIYILRALCRKKLKDFVGEQEDYSSAIKINSQNKRAYIGRALCREKLKDIKGGLKDSLRVIELDPNSMHGFSIASYFYTLSNNKKASREMDLKARNITPVSAEDYFQYAGYKISEKKYEDAIGYNSTTMEINLHDACLALSDIADCKSNLGKYEEAIKDYLKAIELSPDSSNYYLYYYSIARCNEKYNDFDKALEFYNKSIEYNSSWHLPYRCRGELKIKLGFVEDGNADIQKSALLKK